MYYPLDKYRYYRSGNKIIAVSSYAGRPVRGTATCHPDDKFDETLGKKIAAARCAEKIAKRRCKRAEERLGQAHADARKAKQDVERMSVYKSDSIAELIHIQDTLRALLSK